MHARATHRFARVSPQKARVVGRCLKGMQVEQALAVLRVNGLKAAELVRRVLESAVANAEHNEGADVDDLCVVGVLVDEGPVLKRMRARAKGRGNRISKRTSHITVTVAEY